MISRERVLSTLNLNQPDKVPYMEIFVDEGLGQKLLGRKEKVYETPVAPIQGIHNHWFGFIGLGIYSVLPIRLSG